jgi:beta-catenin-like protein 1
MEKDYEKIARLISIRRQYASRLREIELQIERERRQLVQAEQEAAEDEWFSRRLDAGLFVLQSVDTILAWLVAEDSGARKKVVALLGERDESLANIRATLEGQMIGVTEDNEEAKGFKEMLSTLIEFLG